jgi:hypothetical protein
LMRKKVWFNPRFCVSTIYWICKQHIVQYWLINAYCSIFQRCSNIASINKKIFSAMKLVSLEDGLLFVLNIKDPVEEDVCYI